MSRRRCGSARCTTVMNGTETNGAAGADQRRQQADRATRSQRAAAVRAAGAIGFGLRSMQHLRVAEKPTNAANSSAQDLVGNAFASCARRSARPAMMPGASSMTTSQRTAPRWWWVRTDDDRGEADRRERGRDRHLHDVLRTACPLLVSTKVMNGTISMPPPTPSSPARKPGERLPAATARGSAATRGRASPRHSAGAALRATLLRSPA